MSTVDPKDPTNPVVGDKVKQLPEELRALKARINTLELQLMRAPGSETLDALPAAAARANRIQAYNSVGQPIAIVGVDSGSAADLALDLASPAAGKGPNLLGFDPTVNYTLGTLGGHLADMPLCPRDLPWLAKFDGTTDDTAAINACATAARSAGACIAMPRTGTAKVSGTLDFSGLMVIGYGRGQIHLQATSAQFDVMTTTGNTTITGLYVHGGWDGSTAGQSGDILSIKATSPDYPYNIHLSNCVFQYAKKRHIYWERGGYSFAWNIKCNAAGLHSLEMFGNSGGSDSTTTVVVGGFSVFSDCPNGYGVKLTECINIAFDGVLSEYTKGIQINGGTNRALSFNSFYQENTSGGKFIDWAGSAGIGLSVVGCFGGNCVIDYNSNWLNQTFSGNSNLSEPSIPFDSYKLFVVDGGEQLAVSAGSVTAASLDIPTGTWALYGYVQTVNSSGGGITKLAAQITTNEADPGVNNNTGALNFGADEDTYNPGSDADMRVQPFDIIQNTTGGNVTYYLRAYIGHSSGTLAYRGGIKAVRIS